MRLLLLSNSTNAGEPYLDYPKHFIKSFLGDKCRKALFIPYAAVTFSFDEYENRIKARFNEIGHDVISVHHFDSPVEAVRSAEAIVVGGGNTFHLLKLLQQNNLMEIIKEKVKDGIPYIGWSAGSNMACPTICTTNDMPIVQPVDFKAFNFVPFQINPHYTDYVAPGHAGETRDDRIAEFLTANPSVTVVGLREGSILRFENSKLELLGKNDIKIFCYNEPTIEYSPESDFSFLI
jgi:Peptidase E